MTQKTYLIDRLLNIDLNVDTIMKTLSPILDGTIRESDVVERIAVRARMSDHVRTLPKGIEQRTPAWYAARESLITASNFNEAAARPEQFLKKKLDAKAFKGSDATRWGVKYEEVANMQYCHYNRAQVLEYGLLIHPEHEHLGASPDGITDYGVMVEIKCPYSKTLADIPDDYYAQMQGQMECTGLTECDFVVCRVKELTPEHFWSMRADADIDPARLGVVTHDVEYTSFDFTNPDMSDDEVRRFVDSRPVDLITTYHHVWKLLVTRVDKNEEYWTTMLPKLEHTWKLLDDRIHHRCDSTPTEPASTLSFSFKMF